MDSVHAVDGTKTRFELVLFGPPSLRDGMGQSPVGLGSGKPLALLCFLVVRGEVRRDEALDLLWGDVDEARARNAFRQALHRLRLAMGDDLIVADRQTLKIGTTDRIRADVLEFQKALDEMRPEDALALYRGDFLEGFDVGSSAFQQWVEVERARFRGRCLEAAERATQRALAAGKLDDADLALRKSVSLAPLDTRVIELVATSLVSMGRRGDAAEALRQFEARSLDTHGAQLPESLRIMLARLAAVPKREYKAEATRDLPFVGRERELAHLIATWTSLNDDLGGTVIVEGPVGIGKSRLVHEFAESIAALGPAHVLRGSEGPSGFAIPYAAVANAIKPLVRAAGVGGTSPHLLAEAARLLPELRDVFQLPAVESVEEETARFRTFEGVAALIEAAAFERPICLILDDVHRAPDSTLALLGYLAARLRRSHVLLLLTFDADVVSNELAGRVRALAGVGSQSATAGEAAAQHIVLGPLAAADTERLVRGMLDHGVSQDVVTRLAARAAGVPLRAVEMARLAREGVEPSTLPVRLTDLMRDRILVCSAVERRLLLTASLLSRPVTLQLLAEAAHVPPASATSAAESLERRGLLSQEGRSFVVASDPVADTALELAGEPSRAFSAGWAGEVLARDPDAHPAELVRLFAIAGRAGDTYRWARVAGERALARGGITEATHFLTVARTFARTNREHEAVEGLLTALGVGRPRLRGAESALRESGSRAATALRRQLPHWRWLLGVAAATSIVAILVSAWGPNRVLPPAFATTDTLVVAMSREPGRRLVRLVTADSSRGVRVSPAGERSAAKPAWADSVALPWVNAMPSPSGRAVSIERITPHGSSVYVISANRRDTMALAVDVEALAMGWSPDGERLLVTRRVDRAGGDYRLALFAYPLSRSRARVLIDSTTGHSVVEALWSPDGSRVAWVARVDAGQEDVFVAWADGSHRRNLSRNPSRDLHLAWSPDGSLIAFTSWRDGNAELYVYDLLNDKLSRLTRDDAQDDRAAFAGDGRFIAFESTRGGSANVYVMPTPGGNPRRIGDSTSRFEIVGWRRPDSRYIDRLEVSVPSMALRGDTVTMRIRAVDQVGGLLLPDHAQWTVLDDGLLRVVPPRANADSVLEHRFVALRNGLARVAVSVGEWRTDTVYINIGEAHINLLRDDFGGPSLRRDWRTLGQPLPAAGVLGDGRRGLRINADRQWDSGVLLTRAIPLQPGLMVQTTLHAPFRVHATATTVSLALVAPELTEDLDTDAPAFLRLVSMTWSADAQRLIYSVDRDVFVEPVPPASRDGDRTFALKVHADGTVSFLVDGAPRWRSTIRVVRPERAMRALLWLGGQDTGDRIGFSDVSATLSRPAP